MDIYLIKHPEDEAGLLAYINLIRDLERSYGSRAFNFYDQSFRSHKQSQALPWGRMHPELWIKSFHPFGKSTAFYCQHV